MYRATSLIRTKLRMPFTRPRLVIRSRLQDQIKQGLCGPLTLITAPAGFGKTTLVVACTVACGIPVAWLSIDRDDNQSGRLLDYLIAAIQEVDRSIGNEAAQILATSQQVSPEAILTSLINDLDAAGAEIVLVLDDYQFINSQAVHQEVAFLLEYCPKNFHLVIVTRSDPPLPLARLRARGQTVELRAADLRFTELEAAQFLNEVMGLNLDPSSIAALEERTEGWIAGLQMAALSMRDRKDVSGFIEGFSGTNRFILDYLLEEILANQPPDIQRFLLCTSILERLTAPLCDSILANDDTTQNVGKDGSTPPVNPTMRHSASILEYLERANLFLVPLDDERIWYRYHHLFSDLLRTQLQKSISDQGVMQLHLRASTWHEQNRSTLDAIYHASLAADTQRIERLIEQNYFEMMNRGEMALVRFWMGKLSQDMVYRRPWLCLYEAVSHSWFGQLEQANILLDIAEKGIRSNITLPEANSILGYHAYIKSRVTAMQGDTRRAIELCRSARENIPVDNLGLQIDVSITLGYEYFLYGDFVNAEKILLEMIRSCYDARAINNPVAGYAVLARLHMYQGRLHLAYDRLQKATQMINEAGGQYLGVSGLIEVGLAALQYEWNDLKSALLRVKQGLDHLPWWGKVDDLILAYLIIVRIMLAQGNRAEAIAAVEKSEQLVQAGAIFSEARSAVETARVKLQLGQKDWPAVERWVAGLERHQASISFGFEDELAHITQARVLMAQNKQSEAIRLLSCLEDSAQSNGRQGRLLEIIILKALAMQAAGDNAQAKIALTNSLELAEPEGYVRIFLDEGQAIQTLLAQWLAQAGNDRLKEYANRLLAQFGAGSSDLTPDREKAIPVDNLIEPLSLREREVLHLMAMGMTNQEIARQLIVSPGTVKAHTANLYRKLDVANRTEAVGRARQLGIIP